jgi:tripartite-type tricarboxylate transporter receptor subunit TctC
MIRRILPIALVSLVAVVSTGVPTAAFAQAAWPQKPIRVVVPFPAGGVIDATGRLFVDKLAPLLGQTMVVENKPGADTRIGIADVARSPADGHHWLVAGGPAFSIRGAIAQPPEPQLNPVQDFRPVAELMRIPNVLVVPASLPVNSVKELVAHAKAPGAKVSYASAGRGTASQLGMELFRREVGVEMLEVPYKGVPPAMADLITGRVDSMNMVISVAMPHIVSGKLKPLAVLDTRRSAQLPDVPTMVELGYPDATISSWAGLLLPANTPSSIVNRVHSEVVKVLQMPDVIEKIKQMGNTPADVSTPDEFADKIKKEAARLGKRIQESGMNAK